MRITRIPRAAASAISLLILAACGGSEPPSDGGTASSKPRVALVMKSLANEFFQTMEDGARAHHKAAAGRYELIANGIRNEEDVAQQVALVEQMIASGVDAIVIAPADSGALVPVLKRADAAGIRIVNIDNKLSDAALAEAGLRIPFVGPDNRAGARMAGDHLAAKLEPGAEVAILEGIPTAFNAQQRKRGFQDAMDAAGAKVVASQSAYWEMDKAHAVAGALISEHPGLKAILCSNDSMALGAVAALRDAGRPGGTLVIGYDNISAMKDLLASGAVLCTVDQHAGQLAVFGIEHALAMLESGDVPAGDRATPVDLVTAP